MNHDNNYYNNNNYSNIWISFQRNCINIIQNWEQRRYYTGTLSERKEGFTETFGCSVDTANIKEEEHTIIITQHPQCNVRLVQYRPAWEEQLLLRIVNIPYVIVNSNYAVSEINGPLPYYQELIINTNNNDDDESLLMVGKNDNIISVLRKYRNIDLDRNLTTVQRHQSLSDTALIQNQLIPSLIILRYRDTYIWEQIYRQQCLNATTGSYRSKPRWYSFFAYWQAWSERIQALSSLTPEFHKLSIDDTVKLVRSIYEVLERRLQTQQQNDKQKYSYLLGTIQPTNVDCILWDHLMNALSDLHLVIILADFPALLEYVQHIWDTYGFGNAVNNNNNNNNSQERIIQSVSEWNLEENARNAFTDIPLLPSRQKYYNNDENVEKMKHAIDLMKKLSLQRHNLIDNLTIAKNVRSSTDNIIRSSQQKKQQPFITWHRWRLGDSYYPSTTTTTKTDNNNKKEEEKSTKPEEQIRREYQRNDEIWLASVTAITVTILLGFGFANR